MECGHCKFKVPNGATVCGHCGADFYYTFKVSKFIFNALQSLVILVFLWIFLSFLFILNGFHNFMFIGTFAASIVRDFLNSNIVFATRNDITVKCN